MSKPVSDLYGRPVTPAPTTTPRPTLELTPEDVAALVVGHETLAGSALLYASRADDADIRAELLNLAALHADALTKWAEYVDG